MYQLRPSYCAFVTIWNMVIWTWTDMSAELQNCVELSQPPSFAWWTTFPQKWAVLGFNTTNTLLLITIEWFWMNLSTDIFFFFFFLSTYLYALTLLRCCWADYKCVDLLSALWQNDVLLRYWHLQTYWSEVIATTYQSIFNSDYQRTLWLLSIQGFSSVI